MHAERQERCLHEWHYCLSAHRDRMVERWYDAIAHQTFSPFAAPEILARLSILVDQAIAILTNVPFAPNDAEEIGAALVHLRYLDPAVLHQTISVLGEELGKEVPVPLHDVLRERIPALLGAVATGHEAAARVLVLDEQEGIRAALLAERERISGALRESEARFQAIFAGAAIGITLANLEGHAVECNPAIQRMLGYGIAELHQMVFTAITHPDDILVDRALFDELVAGRRDSYQKEKRYRHKDGHVVLCNLTASLVRDTNGVPQFTIGMIEDITDRKRVEADMVDARRRLAESREMERLWTARVLHDNAIQQLLDINLHLTETRRRAEAQASVAVTIAMVDTVQRKIQEVTAQLRDFVRELRPPGLEEFGLTAALEGIAGQLRTKGQRKVTAITLDLTETGTALPLSVSLPIFRVAQEALQNVVAHADAEHVALHLWVNAREVVLTVRDDGTGFIVPTPLNLLMNDAHFGLIGISERVALTGGNLVIASAPGQGTEIRVRVPVPPTEGRNNGGADSRCDRR